MFFKPTVAFTGYNVVAPKQFVIFKVLLMYFFLIKYLFSFFRERFLLAQTATERTEQRTLPP